MGSSDHRLVQHAHDEAELLACATEIAELNEGLDAAKSRLEERVGNLAMAKAKSGHENRMGSDRSARGDNRLLPLTPSTTVQMMQPGFGGCSPIGHKKWSKFTSVSEVKWTRRASMSKAEWMRFRPSVACDLYQEWGATLYSYLDVYFEGHLSEVFDRFPQGDGFGVLFDRSRCSSACSVSELTS